MNKILVPTDLSELGDYAYNIAYRISQSTGAEILLLSIVTAPGGAFFDNQGNLMNDDGIDLTAYHQELAAVQNRLRDYVEDKPDAKACKVVTGWVNDQILKCIDEEGIDMVVMGTHGATGLSEKMIGSHAEQIIRNAPVPVITLKCDRSKYEISDILLAADFCKEEKIDLDPVREIVQAFDAQLHLLKINTKSNFSTQRKIKQAMYEFIEVNELNPAKTKMHVYCDESVEKGILNFSADSGIDFVAMATHQRRGLSRLFRESISEDVVNHNYQPVMTFPIN